MALENRFVVFEETRQNMERNFETSRSKIQTVPSYLREREKYEKYYSPKLISIGPIHHGETKLKRGEQYKLMWASMYAEVSPQTPQLLHKRIADNIAELRELFSWDEIGLAHDHYNDEDLAWMLFVDGCAVLHILEKANLSKPGDLKVKVDILVLVQRDIFLLENQLPYQLLKLLSEDEVKLKVSMHGFCELQNMFTLLESPHSLLFREPEHQIEIVEQSSPPTHLLDCLRISILSSGMESMDQDHVRKVTDEEKILLDIEANPEIFRERSTHARDIIAEHFFKGMESIDKDRKLTDKEETVREIRAHAQGIRAAHLFREPIKAAYLLDVAYAYADRNKKEKLTTYRNIQELKAAAIRVKRQKNISLKNISFSSSFFGGRLHLTPLILDDSTVPTLLNLVAYEMCPDFMNEFKITSYIKLLDLLIDNPEDVKELRSSGILHNSLGSDEEVVELFNTISSGLVHNPILYSGIRVEMEKHYKNKLSIWMTDAYYTYFISPWTIIAFLAALLALGLTAVQTWQWFKSK